MDLEDTEPRVRIKFLVPDDSGPLRTIRHVQCVWSRRWHTSTVIDFPADVETYYRRLATQRRWPAATEAAFWASVAWYRALEESSEPRQYYEYVDREGLVEEGSRWLWETLAVSGETVAIKQIEVSPSGAAHCYWWRRVEDDVGGLTDQPLDFAEPGLSPVSRSVFYALWDSSVDK
ncbi:hypothetical protein [Lentzea sp. NPDC055074]